MDHTRPSGAIVVDLPPATQEQLDRIEGHLQRLNGRLTKLEEQRIPRIEEEIRGPEDERLRQHRPGIVGTVEGHDGRILKLERDRDEGRAVAQTKRVMVGLGVSVLTFQVGMLTLMLRIAGVI